MENIITEFITLLNINLLIKLEANKDQWQIAILIIKISSKIYELQSYNKAINNSIYGHH